MRTFFRTLLLGMFLLGLTVGCQKPAPPPSGTADTVPGKAPPGTDKKKPAASMPAP